MNFPNDIWLHKSINHITYLICEKIKIKYVLIYSNISRKVIRKKVIIKSLKLGVIEVQMLTT